MKRNILTVSLLRSLLYPILYLVILSVLFVILLQKGINKISSQRADIQTAKKTENMLTEKESALKEVRGTITQQVDVVTRALPQENPILVVMSQIKNMAGISGLLLEDLRFGGGAASDKSESALGLSFSVTGEFSQIVAFLKSIQTTAPLISLGNLDFTKTNEVVSMNVRISTSWAAFPEKIPSLSDPLVKMNDDDLELLSSLIKLNPPQFSSLSPQSPSERTNPF